MKITTTTMLAATRAAVSSRLAGALVALTLVAISTAARAQANGCEDECQRKGLCTQRETEADDGGPGHTCTAEDDDDCSGSTACRRNGQCTAKGGICVADSDDDCKASRNCRKRGRCMAEGGKCVAGERAEKVDDHDDEEEQASEGGGHDERAGAAGPACVPGKAEPCACQGGRSGFQVCSKRGSHFNACDCQPATVVGSEWGSSDEVPAGANEPAGGGDSDPSVRLGAILNLLSYTSVTLTSEGGGPSIDGSQTTFGWGEGGGVAVGVFLSDHVLLGTGLSFAVSSLSEGVADDIDTTSYGADLHLQFLLADGTVRPAIDLGVGVGSVLSAQGDVEISTTLFRFGGGVGMYIFLADAVSLDLGAALRGGIGSSEIDIAGSTVGFSASGFALGLSTGFSGWL